jgi:hypothetical protein
MGWMRTASHLREKEHENLLTSYLSQPKHARSLHLSCRRSIPSLSTLQHKKCIAFRIRVLKLSLGFVEAAVFVIARLPTITTTLSDIAPFPRSTMMTMMTVFWFAVACCMAMSLQGARGEGALSPTFEPLAGYRHCACGYLPPSGIGPVATCDSPVSCACLQHRRCLAQNRLPGPQYTNCACDRAFVNAFSPLANTPQLKYFLRFWETATCKAAINTYGGCVINTLSGASKRSDVYNPVSVLHC